MGNPQVTAIMLTADRQAQTDRAVASFLGQTYRPSTLLIYDTGKERYKMDRVASSRIMFATDSPGQPIGALRNKANECAAADILLHMDSDDWSGPYRIEDQVKKLLETGRDCVGYRSVLFYRAPIQRACEHLIGEAWAYHNPLETYCIGASLCYWRKTWERQKFREDLPGPERGIGEDREWLRHVDSLGTIDGIKGIHAVKFQPLVCEIHGANTMDYSIEAAKERGDTFWTRQPAWDAQLQKIMAL